MTLGANERMAVAALTEARESVAVAFARLHTAMQYVDFETFGTGGDLHGVEMQLREKVAGILRRNGERVTKWALSLDSERESMRGQAFGGACSVCGTTLATEADFAEHFVIRDSRYLNIGECDYAEEMSARETESDRFIWSQLDR